MNKEFLKIVGVSFVISISIGAAAYYVGFQEGLDQTKNIVVENVTDINTPDDVTADFSLFWEVWEKLKTEHIKGNEIDEENLLYGAIEGITNAIGDPNTVFFAPEESKKFNEDIRGNFGGIGAEIGIRDNRLIVIAPLNNTPAERAGLLPGDHILQINDKLTDDMTVEEAVTLIRGDLGTIVTLTIIRDSIENSKKSKTWREMVFMAVIQASIQPVVNACFNAPGKAIDWWWYAGDRKRLQQFLLHVRTLARFQARQKRTILSSFLTKKRKNKYAKKYGKVDDFNQLPPEHQKIVVDRIEADFEPEIVEKLRATDADGNLLMCIQDPQCNTTRELLINNLDEIKMPEDMEDYKAYMAAFYIVTPEFTRLHREDEYAGDKRLYKLFSSKWAKDNGVPEVELPEEKGLKETLAPAATAAG